MIADRMRDRCGDTGAIGTGHAAVGDDHFIERIAIAIQIHRGRVFARR